MRRTTKPAYENKRNEEEEMARHTKVNIVLLARVATQHVLEGKC